MSTNTIPSDVPVPLDYIQYLSTLEQKAILRVTNPPPGISGFLFDIDMEQTFELSSEITDHYVENNVSVQDHVALKPERVTLRGLVGELRYTNPKMEIPAELLKPLPVNTTMTPAVRAGWLSLQATSAFNSAIGAATSAAFNGGNIGQAASRSLRASGNNILSTAKYNASQAVQGSIRTLLQPRNLTALLTPGVPLPLESQNAINTIARLVPNAVKTIVKSVKDLVNPQNQEHLVKPFFTKSPVIDQPTLFEIYNRRATVPLAGTAQTFTFLYFYNLWRSRCLCSVETPWGIITNMAIENCRITQEADDKYTSDFTITFKKIRVASDIVTKLGLIEGRNVTEFTERNGAQFKESNPDNFNAATLDRPPSYMDAQMAVVNSHQPDPL